MDVVPFPTTRHYELWYLPNDRTPLRIGEPLHTYEDAIALAEVAARDLPTFGIRHGHILVVWSGSNLKILRTIHLSSAASAPGLAALAATSRGPRPEVVRLVLEDLRQLASEADSLQAAPREWIDRLHAVLRIIAGPRVQRQYRLDGLYGVTVEDLHRRVSGMLRNYDQLMATNVPLTQTAGGEQPLSL